MIKLHKDFLINELNLPDDAIHKEYSSKDRWAINYKIVFGYNGKFYQTYYSVGATEYQYMSPWEHEDDVECVEVEIKEITVKKWVVKNEICD